ncbi:MAG TPA: molybdopterin oxidoreductase [Bdellovibrionota bacterium]|nr:molybdopterin oxidoreductase [Bdellovibrionota bacterium]
MAHTSSHEIRNPGPVAVPGGVQIFFVILALIGVVTFALSVGSDPKSAWSSLVMNHFYFMSLALGGLFFAAIQWATNAMWSAPVRRISEAFTAYLPVVAISFIVLALGADKIYHWTDHAHVAHDPVLSGKAGYLNMTFFVIRNLIAVALWVLFARSMVGNSVQQDRTKTATETLRNRRLAPAFILVFAVTFTMASFDQLMSLDPHWFSTMFGVYMFAGLFYSNLAATCLLTLLIKRTGKLDGIVNENHLHDLGKFMFAFTIFWAYISFSQFMLIWYANLPEETGYFIRRFHSGWAYVSLFLLVGKFMTPFFLLMPRDAKRREGLLMGVAIFMLVAQWIDMMWVVQPEFFKEGPQFGLIEAGVTAGFLGLFGLAVARFLGKYNVVAIGDPRLVESVHHHHQ